MLNLSLRLTVVSIFCCSAVYPFIVWVSASVLAPDMREGSLLYDEAGLVRGSHLIAQGFSSPRYFWPRPSAVGYDASAAGGSNLSPTSPEITVRAKQIATLLGASGDRPVPSDLVLTSGSGLDPNISCAAARYQSERVAHARNVTNDQVLEQIRAQEFVPGGIANSHDCLVNVLALNFALDRQ